MSKRTQFGKKFERDFQDILEELSGRFKLSYVRLYDSHAARGSYLPPAPGDYIAVTLGKARLIELKASEKHQSLRSCLSDNVDLHQAAAHRLWNRAGGVSHFLFYSIRSNEIELWDGLVVGECRAFGNVLPKIGVEGGPQVITADGLRGMALDMFDLNEV